MQAWNRGKYFFCIDMLKIFNSIYEQSEVDIWKVQEKATTKAIVKSLLSYDVK